MADKLNVTTATYRSWETGKRTPGKMAMIELERRITDVTQKEIPSDFLKSLRDAKAGRVTPLELSSM